MTAAECKKDYGLDTYIDLGRWEKWDCSESKFDGLVLLSNITA